uniref:Putative ovule protein n=1 Tax=Solanum chacoense TaxID=4108 RepID=A0A0V0HY70_SOLCH
MFDPFFLHHCRMRDVLKDRHRRLHGNHRPLQLHQFKERRNLLTWMMVGLGSPLVMMMEAEVEVGVAEAIGKVGSSFLDFLLS